MKLTKKPWVRFSRTPSMILAGFLTAMAMGGAARASDLSQQECFDNWRSHYNLNISKTHQNQMGDFYFMQLNVEGVDINEIANRPESMVLQDDCGEDFVYRTLEEARKSAEVGKLIFKIQINGMNYSVIGIWRSEDFTAHGDSEDTNLLIQQ